MVQPPTNLVFQFKHPLVTNLVQLRQKWWGGWSSSTVKLRHLAPWCLMSMVLRSLGNNIFGAQDWSGTLQTPRLQCTKLNGHVDTCSIFWGTEFFILSVLMGEWNTRLRNRDYEISHEMETPCDKRWKKRRFPSKVGGNSCHLFFLAGRWNICLKKISRLPQMVV